VYLVTLTLPHDQGDRLRPLYEAVADSYRYVRTGAEWYEVKGRVGFVGEVRALEVTVGAHGWHPHLHVLLFTARPLDSETLGELRAYLLGRWSRRVEYFGYRAPSEEHGVTIVESHRDDYLAKMGLADELVKGLGKVAQGDSRTPLQVLADFAQTGAMADLALWREFTLAMHGAHQLTWSRGLRERYAPEEEKTDAEIVEGESDSAEETLAAIPVDIWHALVRGAPDTTWQLLDAAETGGADAVEAMIADRLDELRRHAASPSPGPRSGR
jgi:hypothetical protein